jgi:hypothetical protein
MAGRTGKIPEPIIPDILLMRAQGKELVEIKAWLAKTHNISCDIATISRRCRAFTKLDRNLTQAIYARASAQGAMGIVNSLINNLDEIHIMAAQMKQDGNVTEWRHIKKLELEYLNAHMDLFGQTKTEKDDEIEDIDEILGRIGSAHINPDFILDEVKDELPEIVEQENEAVFALVSETIDKHIGE